VTPPAEIRLLTYNVRSLRDDEHAVADIIRCNAPDIVCVQEAPRLIRWRSRCARLARLSGLLVVTGGRLAAGNLILASLRTQVIHTEDVRFPRTGWLHRRGLALAVLDMAGIRIGVVGLHFGLDASERARHLEPTLAYADRLQRDYRTDVLVVAGDLNDTPTGPVWQRLAARWPDARVAAPEGDEATFTSRKPRSRIDGIFTDGVVLGCGVPPPPNGDPSAYATASDHRPVLARSGLPLIT
jgi:endonuclease/exonuclease/phosphatase family metal-dependent hydrolase